MTRKTLRRLDATEADTLLQLKNLHGCKNWKNNLAYVFRATIVGVAECFGSDLTACLL